MSKNCDLSNYDIAKAEADKVDEQIIATLKAGHSFRVEAGAGSGKTYSLNFDCKNCEMIIKNNQTKFICAY